MTHEEAVQAAMDRMSQRMQAAIKRVLVIPAEPSPLPPPESPFYELNRMLHRLIAHQRGRPCGCGGCDE
ncbi:MAG: hypothetical protein HOV70_20160 [Streptomyces sp.]|nr:hypothetical protein [Streptomyces sp.]